MKKTKLLKRIATAVCAVALCLVTLGLPFFSASPKTASADAVEYVEGVNELDKTPVLEDLGEEYVKKYESQTSGQIQLHSFQEYCYSGKPTVLNTKYGLYLYIYNPSRTEFEEKTGWENNTVNMATSYNASGDPDRYDKLRLKNCGYTTGEYDKLFYKFRIIGLEDVVKNVQAMDNQYGYRRYDISEIELRVKGNTAGAHAYTIARTYTYKGYAEGCGSEEASTLVCEQSEMDVLHLKPYATSYRPEGNNGKNEYTQDSLHSVWFSVPNEYIEKYGEMYAVHAMWREAVLKPALVTGNQEAYNAISEYLGVELGGHNENLNYAYLGDYNGSSSPGMGGATFHTYSYSYNLFEAYSGGTPLYRGVGEEIDPLYLMFYSGKEEDSADNYVVSSADLKQAMKDASDMFGGAMITTKEGAYSSALFESVGKLEDYDITKDDTAQLLSKTPVDKSFWDKLFNRDTQYEGGAIENEEIYAIHEVTATDLTGNKKVVADRLYISQSDYDELMKAYSNAQNADETLYLFRFAKSEYMSQEASLLEEKKLITEYWAEVDSNAYFFSSSVYLDFDIIDVTFKKGEVKTVIPVVMSPIDIFSESTPPIDTTEDDPPWWKDLFPGIGGGSGGSQNGGESDWAKAKKILFWVMIGAVVAIVVTVVIVVIVKIRNGHIRSETYKNTRPRKKSYSRSYRKRRR